MDDSDRMEQHTSGVHLNCRSTVGRGDGTWRRCPQAGTVERVHDHDYSGPLVCGCSEPR